MSEKWKVFLSSSQSKELEKERLVLITHFKDNRDFTDNFVPFYFEMRASHEKPEEYCRKNARESKIFLLLLDKELKNMVRVEYEEAVRGGALVYAYARKTNQRSEELQSFITHTLHKGSVKYEFHEADDLLKQVKIDLLSCRAEADRKAEERTGSAGFRDKMVATIEDTKQEKALRLLTEVVFLEDRSRTKEMMYDSLVEGITSAYGKNGCNLHDLAVWATQTFGETNAERIKPNITKTIERMLQQHRLIGGSNHFRLTEKKQKAIEQGTREQNQEGIRILQVFYNKYCDEYNKGLEFTDFSHRVRIILIDIISANAFYFATEVFQRSVPLAIKSSAKLRNMIRGAVSSYLPSDDILAWASLIEEILVLPDPQVQKWIAGLFKSYSMLAALGMDPDCLDHHCSILSNYNIFLDSHIVIRAMVEAGDGYELCKEIISRTKRQNIRMYVSIPMFEEIRRSFSFTDWLVKTYGIDKLRPNLEGTKSHPPYDILKGYLKRLEQDKSLSWGTYLAPFYSKTQQQRLVSYLNETMGIAPPFDPSDWTTTDWDRIKDLRDQLLQLRGIDPLPEELECLPDERKEKLRRATKLRENEAEQIALIYHLRKEAEGKNSDEQYWLLTFDEYVKNLSVAKARSGDDFYQLPCFFQPPTWLDFLGSFGADRIGEVAFREILLSENLSYVSIATDIGAIIDIFKHSYDEKISINTLKAICIETFNKPAIKHLEKEVARASSLEEREVKSDLLREVVFVALRDRIDDLVIGDQKRAKTIHYLRGKVSRLTSERDMKRGKVRRKKKH